MTPEKLREIDERARAAGIRFGKCPMCREYHSVQGVFGGKELCPHCAEVFQRIQRGEEI